MEDWKIEEASLDIAEILKVANRDVMARLSEKEIGEIIIEEILRGKIRHMELKK